MKDEEKKWMNQMEGWNMQGCTQVLTFYLDVSANINLHCHLFTDRLLEMYLHRVYSTEAYVCLFFTWLFTYWQVLQYLQKSTSTSAILLP